MTRWLLPLLLLASVFVHWPGSRADFSYDDRDFVETNQSIRTLAGALAAFGEPFPPHQPQRALYRPLTNLSYAFDHAIWGEQARGYHLANVALYAIVVLLVYGLARAYLPAPGYAFSVALLFSVHPVHCDAVDSIAGRSEILCLLFSLVALLLFLRTLREPRPRLGQPALLASAAAYALACLAKESGAVLPAVLAVHCWVLRPPARGAGLRAWLRELRPVLPHAVVLAFYATLRMGVLGRFSPETAILRGSDFWTHVHTMGTVFFFDLRLLVLPNILEIDYYYQALIGLVDRATAASLLGCLGLLGLLGLALRLVLRHFGEPEPAEPSELARERAVALCSFSIFFVTLLPYSHVLGIGALIAERFLFAPSLGFLLLVVLAGRRLLEDRLRGRAALAIAVLLVAALASAGAWRSHARAADWRDDVRLWRSAERHLRGDKRVHTNLAGAYIERGELGPARAQLEKALELDPHYIPALGNLGIIQLEEGRFDEATASYRHIIEADPRDFLAWNNLGIIEMRRYRYASAVEHFRHALEINPNFAWARRNLRESERALSEARGRPAAQGSR
jgi:tetratricopeptide (TPR) repeat protein